MSAAEAAVQEAHAEEQRQYLSFVLGGEIFAVSILAIKEIIEYRALTAVPMMPASVRGVINLRGAVLPVVDLNARFGRDAAAVGRRSCIVIVEGGAEGAQQDVGVLVDAVNSVLEIPQADIEPPPAFGSRIRSEFIHGLGKMNGRFVTLLDLGRVLDGVERGAAG